ncbi:MAG: hypothetical protein IJM65_07750, partial [Bacteroidales bacterium]|nr:hypothetical protein [Bacteroidales bacterium]
RQRFDTENAEMPGGASFDMVRASVNLVLASVLIVIGTNYKLPLSTTYMASFDYGYKIAAVRDWLFEQSR